MSDSRRFSVSLSGCQVFFAGFAAAFLAAAAANGFVVLAVLLAAAACLAAAAANGFVVPAVLLAAAAFLAAASANGFVVLALPLQRRAADL